jgi:aldose 1-epimerase
MRLLLIVLLTMTACSIPTPSTSISTHEFGITAEGAPITAVSLQNTTGVKVTLSSLGASIVGIQVPDSDGQFEDVVLGYDSGEGYAEDRSFFGYTVGRYANRIAGGSFVIDGKRYHVDKNEGQNHLHGGHGGFHTKNWSTEISHDVERPTATFTLTSHDGEQGFPGTASIKAIYSLHPDNSLHIELRATSTAPTVINLTNHAYFNLSGAGNGDILDHTLSLNSSQYTPTTDDLIPTGEIHSTAGTYLDFTRPVAVGSRRTLWPKKLPGYDHNFILNGERGTLRSAATLVDPKSGRALEVLTTAPGIQVYSGIHLNDVQGKGGRLYKRYGGICLEAQNFPDAPNKPEFPSPILRPGEEYKNTIIYRFFTKPR